MEPLNAATRDPTGEQTPYVKAAQILGPLLDQDIRELLAAHPDSEVVLPLRLSFEPLLLQYCLSLGTIKEEHVALLSLKRLLLRSIQAEYLVPPEAWDVLRDFGVTKQLLFGRGSTYFDCGRGGSAHHDPAKFTEATNSGSFSVTTLKRAIPAAQTAPGPVIEDFLNLLEAGLTVGSGATYTPSSNVLVTFACLLSDGMLIKNGHATDENKMVNVGSLDHNVTVGEAEELLAMTDEGRRQFLNQHPLITEFNEVMAAFLDNSAYGHVGFEYTGKGGGASAVAARTDLYLRNSRVCRSCLQDAFEATLTDDLPDAGWAKAKGSCDKHCVDCMLCSTARVADSTLPSVCRKHSSRKNSHWTEVCCTACSEKGAMCHNISFEIASMDCCGSQESYAAQVCSRAQGMYGTGDHVVIGDIPHLVKTEILTAMNHWIRYNGEYLGVRQLISVYFDVFAERRERFRDVVHWSDLEGKNKFDVEARVVIASVKSTELLSPSELESSEPVYLLTILVPERRFFWKEAAVSSIITPGGAVFHPLSGIVLIVERETNSIYALRLGHCPVYYDYLLGKGSSTTVAFVAITLHGSRAYVTDERGGCVWMADFTVVLTSNRSGDAGSIVDGDGDDGPDSDARRGAHMPASAKFHKVAISFRPMEHFGLRALHGIVFDERGSAAYVADSALRCVYCFLFSSPTAALVTRLCSFADDASFRVTDRPRGIALYRGSFLVVTVADKLVLVPLSGAQRGVYQIVHAAKAPISAHISPADAATQHEQSIALTSFYGIAVSANNDVARVTSDAGVHALWEFRIPLDRSSQWEGIVLAGGNTCFEAGIQGQEGTARAVQLYRPSFCCFALESFVLVHTGAASIMLMTNLRTLALYLLPNMRKLAEAGGLCEKDNASNMIESYGRLRAVDDMFTRVQSSNTLVIGRPTGQGNEGCFSRNLRRSIKTLCLSLERKFAEWHARKVPDAIVRAFNLRAALTLPVEGFFSDVRSTHNSGGGNPYALDCARYRGRTIHVESKAKSDLGYSHYTGPSAHYMPPSSSPVLQVHSRPKKLVSTAGSMLEPSVRLAGLAILRRCAKYFRGPRTGRVTDKGKHQPGTGPTSLRAGFAPAPDSDRGASQLLPREFNAAECVASGISRVLHFAGTLVIVKIVHAGQECPFQLVELRENLIEQKVLSTRKRDRHRGGIKYIWQSENWNPLVADFHQDGNDSYHFVTSSPIQLRRLNASSFYGAIDDYFDAIQIGGELTAFSITEETYEAAVSRVCAPPGLSSALDAPPVQSDESESDSGSNSDGDSSLPARESVIREARAGQDMPRRAGRFDLAALGLMGRQNRHPGL